MGVPPTLQRQDSGGNGAWAHLDPRVRTGARAKSGSTLQSAA
jgi:hypothetical protein